MATVQVNEQTFGDLTKPGTTVIFDFWAGWCAPCRAFAPVFEAASERHPDVVFAKIDTEAEPAIAAAFEIRSIPTVMVMRDGVILFMEAGALPAPALDHLLSEVKALDMDEIRRKLDEEGAAGEGD